MVGARGPVQGKIVWIGDTSGRGAHGTDLWVLRVLRVAGGTDSGGSIRATVERHNIGLGDKWARGVLGMGRGGAL